jgi:hypothetical protein
VPKVGDSNLLHISVLSQNPCAKNTSTHFSNTPLSKRFQSVPRCANTRRQSRSRTRLSSKSSFWMNSGRLRNNAADLKTNNENCLQRSTDRTNPSSGGDDCNHTEYMHRQIFVRLMWLMWLDVTSKPSKLVMSQRVVCVMCVCVSPRRPMLWLLPGGQLWENLTGQSAYRSSMHRRSTEIYGTKHRKA